VSTHVEVLAPEQVVFALESDFIPYTVATSAALNSLYPAASLNDLDQDSTIRTTGAGPADFVVLDLGATITEDILVYLYGANFTNFSIAGGATTSGTFTTVPPLYVPSPVYECQPDMRTGIRKGWWIASPWNYRYLRLHVSDAPVEGYLELAELVVVKVSKLVGPSLGHTLNWPEGVTRPGKTFNPDQGGHSTVNLGRRRVQVSWESQEQPAADYELMMQVAQMDEDRAILFIENFFMPASHPARTTDTSRVELCQRTGVFQTQMGGEVNVVGINLEEI